MIEKESKILKLVEIAKSLEGRPYKYGAKMKDAPKFFDCSLFTQYVFLQIGIKLPRTAIEQAMVGKKVALAKIKEGDVVFMKGEIGRYNKYYPDGIGHAGMCIGGAMAIHAEGKRTIDRYTNLYHQEFIKESGKVRIENLNQLIKRKKPLVVIKRYV